MDAQEYYYEYLSCKYLGNTLTESDFYYFESLSSSKPHILHVQDAGTYTAYCSLSIKFMFGAIQILFRV